MKFKYTFMVKEFKGKFNELVKFFDNELSNFETQQELGVIFDSNNVKNVYLKAVEKLNDSGEVIQKIDFKKW